MPAEFLRYLVAGGLNTVAGYLSFLFALHVLGLNAFASNVVSYAVGLVVAYILNLTFVFKETQHSTGTLWRFGISFLLAYGANIFVLYTLIHYVAYRPEVAQLGAMACYTVVFYLLNRSFVWKN